MSSENSKQICKNHGHEHDHGHKHDHEHEQWGRLFAWGIALNALFVIIEFGFGYWNRSLALIADAAHNLTDVFGLLLAWLGFYLSKKSSNQKYAHATAFLNSLILCLGSVWIMFEAYERFFAPQVQAAAIVIFVAQIGFVINFISVKLFHGHQHDLNMKSAYLHLLGDAAISLGVAVSGTLMYFGGWNWLDSLTSLVISVVIIFTTFPIIKQSLQKLRD